MDLSSFLMGGRQHHNSIPYNWLSLAPFWQYLPEERSMPEPGAQQDFPWLSPLDTEAHSYCSKVSWPASLKNLFGNYDTWHFSECYKKCSVNSPPCSSKTCGVDSKWCNSQGSEEETEYGGDNDVRQKINKKQEHFQMITYSWEDFHINLDSPFFPDLISSTFFMTTNIQGWYTESFIKLWK